MITFSSTKFIASYLTDRHERQVARSIASDVMDCITTVDVNTTDTHKIHKEIIYFLQLSLPLLAVFTIMFFAIVKTASNGNDNSKK